MNLILLTGNLTKDPDIKRKGENVVANLSIAVSRSYAKDGQTDTDFFRITAFGKQAELAERYLSKGKKIAIEGRIQNDNYENSEGQKVYRDSIIANRMEFLSPKASEPPTEFKGEDDLPF